MGLEIRLCTKGDAEDVIADRRPDVGWAPEYPLDGDARACLAYVNRMAGAGPKDADPFGYYYIVVDGEVVGGAGFHGPPVDGLVEIGYGVVPAARGQGVATAALRELIKVAGGLDGVRVVCGRTSPDNVASQRVMLGAGMQLVGRDPEYLHYETDL